MNHHKNKASPRAFRRPLEKSPDQSKKIPVRGRSRLFTEIRLAKTQHELLHLHIPLEVLATFTIFIVTTSSSRERYLIAWRQKQSLPDLTIVKSTPLSTSPFFWLPHRTSQGIAEFLPGEPPVQKSGYVTFQRDTSNAQPLNSPRELSQETLHG